MLTWLSKVAQWIIAHHPTIVSQKVTDLVWLVKQLHLLLQSHVLIWESEIPERDRQKHSNPFICFCFAIYTSDYCVSASPRSSLKFNTGQKGCLNWHASLKVK